MKESQFLYVDIQKKWLGIWNQLSFCDDNADKIFKNIFMN